MQQVNCDYKEMYLATFKREQGLKKKLDEGTEQHLADTKKLNKFYMKTKKENDELKDQVKYLEDEVCRYSNAIEEEYVLKTDYEELEEELADKEVLAKAYKENKIEIMKLKEENEELKEEAEQNKQLFDTTFGELMKLKEEVAGYQEYQNEVDTMENNLLNLLEEHEVRDSDDHLYTNKDSEVRYYDVPDIVEGLIAEKKK